MDKYYSYTDFLKAVGQQSTENQAGKLLSEIYLDLFLSRLQRMNRIEQLKILIGTSLDQRDEQAFLSYTTEINELYEATKY